MADPVSLYVLHVGDEGVPIAIFCVSPALAVLLL